MCLKPYNRKLLLITNQTTLGLLRIYSSRGGESAQRPGNLSKSKHRLPQTWMWAGSGGMSLRLPFAPWSRLPRSGAATLHLLMNYLPLSMGFQCISLFQFSCRVHIFIRDSGCGWSKWKKTGLVSWVVLSSGSATLSHHLLLSASAAKSVKWRK